MTSSATKGLKIPRRKGPKIPRRPAKPVSAAPPGTRAAAVAALRQRLSSTDLPVKKAQPKATS